MDNKGSSVQLLRTNGRVVLARAGGTVFLSPFRDFGHLAGDGRRYFVVGAYDGSTPDSWYFVPLDVSAGTHDPREVGVRVGWHYGSTAPIGDQNHDGADDFVFGGTSTPGAISYGANGFRRPSSRRQRKTRSSGFCNSMPADHQQLSTPCAPNAVPSFECFSLVRRSD